MFRLRLGIFGAASACGALLISKSLLCDNSGVEIKSKERLKSLLDKKGLVLWGSNAESVVDPENPGVSSRKTPRRLSAFDDISFKCVQLHKTYAAAVDSKGDLFVWGSAFFGKGQKHVPVRIASGLNIEKVALSDRFLTVLKSSGEVLSFEVKEGASADNVTKVALKVPQKNYFDYEKATDIVAGKDHFLILSSKGSVYSAGSNSKGQLGSGEKVKQNDSTSQSSPIADLKLNLVGGIAGEVVEIASGDNHCLARTSDGRVYGWGSNESGELGEGVYSNDVPLFFNAPIELRKIWSVPKSVEVSSVGADGKITGIYAAGKNSYFVKEDASTIEVLAAGYGLNGQTGNGSPIHVASEPVRIRKLSGLSQYNEESKSMKPIEVKEIVASGTHAFAVIGSGSEGFGNDVLAWGSNTNGECFVDVPSLNIQSPVLVKPVFESDNDSIDRFQLVKTSRQDGKDNWGWLTALFGNNSCSKALLRTDISCGPHTTAVFTKSS
jgi:alpha-tubulin suppressor-like RCC1 family protein